MLDHEARNPRYIFSVQARDGGNPSLVTTTDVQVIIVADTFDIDKILFRAIPFEKVAGGGDIWRAFLKMQKSGLKIVPTSLQGGLAGCFLHCVNGKKITARYPQRKWKIAAGGLKSRRQTPHYLFKWKSPYLWIGILFNLLHSKLRYMMIDLIICFNSIVTVESHLVHICTSYGHGTNMGYC